MRTEVGINGKQQSTYDNRGGRGGYKKWRMGHTFDNKRQGGPHGGAKENSTLVSGMDCNMFNATCYTCHRPGHLNWYFSEAGCTGTCSLQVLYSFANNHIQQNYPINKNWIILYTCSSAGVMKNEYLAKNVLNCNEEDKLLIMKNGGHLFFNHMGQLLLLPTTVHIN